MANFEGYLFGKTGKNGSIVPFPNKYIEFNSWSSNPNQREEIKAYRDDNTRDLFRITAAGKKSTFSFKTRSGLHLSDKMAIQEFFTSGESNSVERKIALTFWDDENNQYKSGAFYRPNMPFPIISITQNDIIYGQLEFEFIEY